MSDEARRDIFRQWSIDWARERVGAPEHAPATLGAVSADVERTQVERGRIFTEWQGMIHARLRNEWGIDAHWIPGHLYPRGKPSDGDPVPHWTTLRPKQAEVVEQIREICFEAYDRACRERAEALEAARQQAAADHPENPTIAGSTSVLHTGHRQTAADWLRRHEDGVAAMYDRQQAAAQPTPASVHGSFSPLHRGIKRSASEWLAEERVATDARRAARQQAEVDCVRQAIERDRLGKF
jgi:hypothetical protein